MKIQQMQWLFTKVFAKWNRISMQILVASVALLLLADNARANSEASSIVLGSSYWAGFKDYWHNAIQQRNGILFFILGIGAVAIFIITRGKAKK